MTVVDSVTLYLVIGALGTCCTAVRATAAAYARETRAAGHPVRIVREQCTAAEWAAQEAA